MREVKAGDIVFHFIDNKEVVGVSVVSKEYDDTFVGLEGTKSEGKPAYLIRLKNYIKLIYPINRSNCAKSFVTREGGIKAGK